MKVMLVDDTATMRVIQRNLLRKLGVAPGDIVEATDGEEAFRKLSTNPVDVIFLDVHMPKMNGIELLRKIRGMDEYKNIKIVMCTTESEKKKILEAVKIGVNGYIVKPFTPQVIHSKLKELKLLD